MEQPNIQAKSPKRQSTKPSITGGVLSLLALLSSGIAKLMIYFGSQSSGTGHNDIEKAGGAIADGVSMTVFAILSVPFAVGSIVLGIIAIVFTVLRLRKIKVVGLILSILFVILAVWAFTLGVSVFDAIKADPQT